MNCQNHPDTPVTAYCQNCGKPLCSACVRQVANVTYCEPCLAARLGIPTAGAAASSGSYTVGAGDGGQFHYSQTGPLPPGMPETGPNPGLATLLGFIPGVGAMYNGQFIKALVHVLVFVILISFTDQNGIFGIFIAAWVFYQVFDAHHTAKARRDGMPLPDPFGLNELGAKLGFQSPRPAGYGGYGAGGPYAASGSAPGAAYPPYTAGDPASTGTGVGPDGNPAYTSVPPVGQPGAPGTPVEGYTPFEPGPLPPASGRPEPVGAIVLIGLGVLFLMGTMGVFHFNWIGHGWPLILIGIGIWVFLKRSRELPPGGGL